MSSVPLEQALSDQLKIDDGPPIPTNWFDLPFEMREMVIDRMDPKTRCRFAHCSKVCEEEAKGSKNYLYGISVSSSGEPLFENLNSSQSFILQIYHNKKEADYTIKFIADGTEKTTVVYETYTDQDKPGNFGHDGSYQDFFNFSPNQNEPEKLVKWRKVEKGNPSEVRSKYFNEYVDKYKHSIKYLLVDNEEFSLIDHNARNLKYLENISFAYCPIDVIQCGFLTKNQIMNAKKIHLADTNFTFEEVIQFEGSEYTIKSEDFDEDHIVEYIKLWKNGKVSKNLKNLRVFQISSFFIFKKNERVDFGRLMEGLDAFDFKSYGDIFEFKFYADHHKKDQLRTTVQYDPCFFAIGI